MGKIALLVSREEMLYQAHNILQEKTYDIAEMRVIRTEDAVSEARHSIANGASIIIARGLQASLIRQYTEIPVADITLTAQEMALLVVRAKQILKKTVPVIGVVGFANMFCDMSYFDTIHEIDLRTYYAGKGSELAAAAADAVADGVDLIIGGDTAVGAANRHGVPSLFLSITEDSMRNAFAMAERMDFAMGAEKRNAAQMETLLDNSFSGVVRLDADGLITDINPVMEGVLTLSKDAVKGKTALSVFPEMDRGSLNKVLEGGKEPYSLFMQVNHTSVFAVAAPVVLDGRIDGVILTCHRMKKRRTTTDESRRSRQPGGFIALGEFEDMLQRSKPMQKCIQLAKLYALSEKPVLIAGETGTEKRLLAESIHNAGPRRGQPFVNLSCDGLSDEMQQELLFGGKGAVAQAAGGTLLLEDIGCLTRANQYRLEQLIRRRLRIGAGVIRSPHVDVRVIVSERESLAELLGAEVFRADLYYLLAGLSVRVPPLRERPEDLERRIDDSIRECGEHYSGFHVLTAGAKKLLLGLAWEGNLFQVDNFCERLVLTAGKRSLDEGTVRHLYDELYPPLPGYAGCRSCENGTGAGGAVSSGRGRVNPLPDQTGLPREAAEITAALGKYSGNRGKTAAALGISKATLWRRMKRFDIK